MMKGLIYGKREYNFFYSLGCDLWNYVINDHVVPTHSFNYEVANKDRNI